MSDIGGNIETLGRKAERICRVAYTLNNHQPVICTIVGDQPLFYMDYGSDADDNVLDTHEFCVLENEIRTLQKEIENFDRYSQTQEAHPDASVEEFLENGADVLDGTCNPSDEFTLKALLDAIAKSRIGKAYIEFAQSHNVEIAFSRQVESAFYDRKDGKIFINPDMRREDQCLLTARELRRHWQHRQGALINPLLFHPDNAVVVNRVQMADLAVAMVRLAWELQLTGERKVWDRIEDSSLADLARAFAREAFMDFRTLNNGQASAAVFETWFLSERCRHEDKKLIKQMLADYHGYVFDLQEAGASVTPTLIAALGEMPFGKNYLAIHAETIMNDPIFTEVRDRSNANFLWFIKFERSFRETEQELQTPAKGSADGVRQTVLQDTLHSRGFYETKEADAQNAAPADIIKLFSADKPATPKPGGKRLSAKGRKKHKSSEQGAEIVYLRRWSGDQ